MKTSTIQPTQTAIANEPHHLSAADCFKIYDLGSLPNPEKIALAAMLTQGIEAPLPSDVATIAATASDIMMDLYSYECVMNCAWEAIPETCDQASDAREAIRIAAKLIAKEAEKIEMKVVWPLKKLTT